MNREFTNEAGSTSIMVIALTIIMLTATLFAVSIGRLSIEHKHVQNAADASALAGASSMLLGNDQVCARASQIAESNGVTIHSCVVNELDVRVNVQKSFKVWGVTFRLSSTARAGSS